MKKTLLTLRLVLVCVAIAFGLAVCAQAQTVNYFADFNRTNGWEPYGSVTQATNGYFYGTTSGGVYGVGNLFRLIPGRGLVSLYTFCSQANCADGGFPETAPILGGDGNLYGVTAGGGNGSCGHGGVVYRMTLDGKITVLYSFSATCTDGATPNGIVLAGDGNFYGTTVYGGAGSDGPGTIFKITPGGKYTQLYSFCSEANCSDGEKPFYPPVQGDDGNFYGTADSGGSLSGGVIWKLTASGTYSVLYNFCSVYSRECPEGSNPYAITKDAEGNFVGTTETGGGHNMGVVFKVTPAGQYSVLYNFNLNVHVGTPAAPLILASDGNFYGTFTGGGSGSWAPAATGAIYSVTPDGVYTQLHTFCQCSDHSGFTPLAPVFQATDGTFYGTTAYGGIGRNLGGEDPGFGTVFQFSNGLGPLVQTVPTASRVGNHILVLGNGLTGTTSVTFNGVPAAFTVKSNTYIQATVPAGATTGTVSVGTPSGTLNSNPRFVVTK